MSEAEVYVTNAIHWTGSANTHASIRSQITQFKNLKIAIPRKGMRTADLEMNLMSPELTPLYVGDQFSTYSNFLYIKWRGHVVYWGPIIIKEVDYEASTVTLHSKDQGSRLEKAFFVLGDTAMDGPKGTGHLPVSWDGIRLCIKNGNDHLFPGYVALGVAMGANDHTSYGRRIEIERSQEVWRTMLDLGERTDGPLFEFVPLDISNDHFAVCNVYGQERTDLSSTVKFHYGTGWNNVRNIRSTIGGEVLSNATIVTANKHWRSTAYYQDTGQKYGLWAHWEQVDFDMDDNDSDADVTASLGAVGDTLLDAYARPLTSIEVTMRRDDQIQDLTHQFHWLEDFLVADIVEIQGQKGPESFIGKYLIDAVRLEQESDNSAEMRQGIDVIPHVPTGLYTYEHDTDRIHTYDTTGSG